MVVIENLNVKGMLRNHKLARAISDIGFGEFRRQLEYKSIIFGTQIILADRWFPSSKKCSSCGRIKSDLSLADCVYRCECGLVEDRDLNAAKNLGTLGLRGTHACGQGSSGLSIVVSETGLEEAGTKSCSLVGTY